MPYIIEFLGSLVKNEEFLWAQEGDVKGWN